MTQSITRRVRRLEVIERVTALGVPRQGSFTDAHGLELTERRGCCGGHCHRRLPR